MQYGGGCYTAPNNRFDDQPLHKVEAATYRERDSERRHWPEGDIQWRVQISVCFTLFPF